MFLKMIVFNLCKNVVEIMLNLLTVFFYLKVEGNYLGREGKHGKERVKLIELYFMYI